MRAAWRVSSLAILVAALAAGCLSSRAGDYYARPLLEAAQPRARLTARFRIEPAPPGCAEGAAPIVFLPALGITQHGWATVAARLHACRPRVLVDSPGIGESAPADAFSAEEILAALADVLDAVSPSQPVILAGHSLGGAMAARLAARMPGRVAALVLVDAPLAPLQLDRWERILLRASLWPPLLHLAGAGEGVALGLRRVSGGGDSASPLDVALIADEWSDHTRRGAILADYRAFLEPDGLRRAGDALDALRMPVLLVWGSDDQIVPLAVGRGAEARLRRVTTVRLRLIAGAGHMAPLAKPDDTAVAIDEFLEALAPVAATTATATTATTTTATTSGVRNAATQRHPGDRVWDARRELFPLLGINALFPLDGRTDLSLVAGVARGGLDRHYPVEAGRIALTAGATLRLAENAGASFAYLRATARFELVWRWAGGFHVDGTLLIDPRTGHTGGYGALGYAASALPWARLFVAGGALPGEGARVFVGVEIDARLTGWIY